MEEEYTFVTLDDNDAYASDEAILINMDEAVDLGEAVTIDDDDMMNNVHDGDFITLSDDTVMLSDADMLDMYSTDMGMDDSDISFILGSRENVHIVMLV